MGGAAARGFGPDFASSMSDIFDDLFGEFMGGRRGQGRQRTARERGADLRYNLEITLTEAFAGKTAQICVPTSVSCETCSGSGAQAGTKPTTCTTCGGYRQSARQPGLLHDRAHLPQLPGPRRDDRGSLPRLPRLGPRHQGAHALRQHPGRRRGRHPHQARGRRRSGPARRHPPATSTSSSPIKPHEFFQRDGADIFCKVPISMTTAALGGQIEVPTVDGTATRVKIPEGSESRKQFRLQGQRHARAALQGLRRHVHPRSRSRRRRA